MYDSVADFVDSGSSECRCNGGRQDQGNDDSVDQGIRPGQVSTHPKLSVNTCMEVV